MRGGNINLLNQHLKFTTFQTFLKNPSAKLIFTSRFSSPQFSDLILPRSVVNFAEFLKFSLDGWTLPPVRTCFRLPHICPYSSGFRCLPMECNGGYSTPKISPKPPQLLFPVSSFGKTTAIKLGKLVNRVSSVFIPQRSLLFAPWT